MIVTGVDHKAVIVFRCHGCGRLRPVVASRVILLRFKARGEMVRKFCMGCRTQTYHEPTDMTIQEMEA